MATDFKEIEEYIMVQWYNYNPPSIDQDNLLHLEKNIKLNRDTINEIIRRLGIVPDGGTSGENQEIYDSSIYDTLINFKDQIKQLQNNKVDKTDYNAKVNDLQNQINNRLRKDQDDVSVYSYTFKKLTLTDSLSVGTTSSFGGAITTKSSITATGKVTANGGVETSTLKTTGATVLGSTVEANGKATLNNGLTVKQGGNLTGTLTVDNLIVTGNITCNGAGNFGRNITCYELTANRQVTVNCNDSGNLWIKKNYIEMGASAEHRLWVQGANVSLRNGDALIRTVG